MKKRLQYTPSTAHRVHYSPEPCTLNMQSATRVLFSPNLMTPSHRRNQKNLQSKVSSIKEAIDDIISTVSAKRSVQRSAIQRVYEVNTQLKEQLSNSSKNQTSYHSIIPQEKTFDEASTFIEYQKSRNSLHSIQDDESIRLKQTLNSKMKQTNELMARLKNLQNQHEYLRDQSIYGQNTVSQYEIQKNQRLKDQLRRLNHQQSSGYTVSDLWQEFCQLKEENEGLRQETISMLKAESRGHRFSKNSEESSTVVY